MIPTKKISIGQLETITGGKSYVDTTTIISASEGNQVQMTNTISSTYDINMPSDFTEMWDDQNYKLLAVNEKDFFTTELRFKAYSSVANGRMAVKIDIGGSIGVIRRETLNLHKTALTEEDYSIVMNYYTGSTFITNGGKIYFEAIDGDLTISHPSIIPFRIHKGYTELVLE